MQALGPAPRFIGIIMCPKAKKYYSINPGTFQSSDTISTFPRKRGRREAESSGKCESCQNYITSESKRFRKAARHSSAESSEPRKPKVARMKDHPYEYWSRPPSKPLKFILESPAFNGEAVEEPWNNFERVEADDEAVEEDGPNSSEIVHTNMRRQQPRSKPEKNRIIIIFRNKIYYMPVDTYRC